MFEPRRFALVFWIWLSLSAAFPGPAATASQSRPAESADAEIDKLFASWNRTDRPGGAVVVVRDGRVIFEKGYGSANLEWSIPNTPRTVFCIGSVSKQFTAYAVALLAAEGRLRLDDDYRKYIPEMPDYGPKITVGDLIHHTSGIRDDQMLLYLGDWEQGELHGAQAVIDGILARQKGLLFRPGEAYDYSSANYCLLGEIVRRVGGKSLREFARTRIFEPLGMASTFFLDDYREIVKNRAWSYNPSPTGDYRAYIDNHDQVGAGGIYTTVGDMARWNSNFDTPKAGGPEVVRMALTPGRLRNGELVGYAFGLEVDNFRGLRVVRHDGSYGGYRAMFLRFPDERFAVFVAANAGDMDTRAICYRISRIFLRDKMKDSLEEPRAFIPVDEPSLHSRSGDYLSTKSADLLSLRPSGGRLLCTLNDDLKVEYAPVSTDEFRPVTPGYPVVLMFGPSAAEGKPAVSAFQSGKLLQTYRLITRAAPTAADLKEIEGEYYGEELKVTYRFEVVAGKLYVRFKRAPKSDLKPLGRDQFAAWPLMFDFERDAAGRIQGFRLGKIGPQGIPFVRVKADGASGSAQDR